MLCLDEMPGTNTESPGIGRRRLSAALCHLGGVVRVVGADAINGTRVSDRREKFGGGERDSQFLRFGCDSFKPRQISLPIGQKCEDISILVAPGDRGDLDNFVPYDDRG